MENGITRFGEYSASSIASTTPLRLDLDHVPNLIVAECEIVCFRRMLLNLGDKIRFVL